MITSERFSEVLVRCQGKEYTLRLGAVELSILHGLIALAMDHPGIQVLHALTIETARKIRDGCLDCFRDMGFSDEEVLQLDTKREERDTGQNIRLGPRLIMVREEALGTADDLTLQVAEATAEELEKLKEAEAITLVRIMQG